MSDDSNLNPIQVNKNINILKSGLNSNQNPDFFINIKFISGEDFLATFLALKNKFPNLFSLEDVKVFKVGIRQDIKKYKEELGLTSNKLSSFINHYTNTPDYIKSHQINADRYDLDGNAVGKVTAEEYRIKLKSNKLYKKIIKFVEQKNTQKDK